MVQAGSEDFREEWRCMYPAPGDLMLVPIKGGFGPLPGTANLDSSKDHLDIAFFSDRGSNLYGPEGPSSGNIFATVCDMLELETMAKACSDLWFTGAVDEKLYLEIPK
ncbi:DUF3830 family protein [Mesorhizobium sp. M1322]|uniref:DUF3830 family protein n=1 Tax=Mesorhizobium sp. M1322 TaxID=2957081 RepID=UPI00333CD995